MAPRSQPADEDETAVLQKIAGASLGPRFTEPVLPVLQAHHARVSALEASIRRVRSGQIRGGRMMIERAGLPLGLSLAQALGVLVPEQVRQAAEAAAGQGLPIIAGWDASREPPSVKLYINASDASAEVRRRIARRLALPELLDAPHVIGFNLHGQDEPFEIKAYVQSRDAAEASRSLGDAAEWLAHTAEVSGGVAGAVSCWDVVGQQARPRAFFVALQDGAEDGGALLVGRLPGWDAARADACVPFERGPARSVGVGLRALAGTGTGTGTGTGAGAGAGAGTGAGTGTGTGTGAGAGAGTGTGTGAGTGTGTGAGAGAGTGAGTGTGGGPEVWTAYFKPKALRRSLWTIEPAACFRAGGIEIGVFVEPVEHAAQAFVRTDRHALSYRLRQGPREALGQQPPAALVKLMAWAATRVRAAERVGEIGACLQAPPPPPWEIVRG